MVRPFLPELSDVLYESVYEAQLWMLYDKNKQLLKCGDAFPSKFSASLPKGDYILKCHVRHDNTKLLDKIKDIPVILERKLSVGPGGGGGGDADHLAAFQASTLSSLDLLAVPCDA